MPSSPSTPTRPPTGPWRSASLAGVRRYLDQNFAVEEEIECWFGEPIVSGDRVGVE